MSILWNPVDSSNVEAMAFSADGMSVKFKGGVVYRYPTVPEVVYRQVLTAESVGKEFNLLVRNKFDFEKMPQH